MIRIEAAKSTYDLNLLQTAIQTGIEKLSQYSLTSEALYYDKDILDRLIGRYVTLASENADLGTLRAIIG